MYACDSGNTETAKILLDKGAVVDHCNKVKDFEHVIYIHFN